MTAKPAGNRQLTLPAIPRDTGEPRGYLVRSVSILIRLLRVGAVDFEWYRRQFELSERQFARDLQHLRKIGDELGFRIGKRRSTDGRATLDGYEGVNRLGDRARTQEDALRTIVRALGAPVARDLGIEHDQGESPDRFLLFAFPRLQDGTPIAAIFDTLKGAFEHSARVRFRYRGPLGDETARLVEPYRVLARAGRFFLIGYDTAPRKGWRYFALDRIVDVPVRAGSFQPRAVPASYLACDAVGMLTGASTTEVTVRLSPRVAASTTSRRWQRAQHVVQRRDGSADVTFTVQDIDEVVRWALGFGTEARVVAPERAVIAARRTSMAIAESYAASPVRQAVSGAIRRSM